MDEQMSYYIGFGCWNDLASSKEVTNIVWWTFKYYYDVRS